MAKLSLETRFKRIIEKHNIEFNVNSFESYLHVIQLYPRKFFYIISLVKVFEEFGVRFPVQRIKRMVEHQKKSNLTLYYFFLKFGKNEGKNRYNSYRSKQSYSNSVEYFVKKHGDKGYDIWERDRIKIEFAESKGFQVLVVWESEYKQNKLETIRRCNEFVNN